jgi:GNAT superfamily N-acetyltransferase
LTAAIQILPYAPTYRQALLDLSLAAWEPVFSNMRPAVPDYVFQAFYPDGWKKRQLADIDAFIDESADLIWLALRDDILVGWVGGKIHPEDRMGEIFILAVAPTAQRQGIAGALMEHVFNFMRGSGMSMMMVETGDDPGHAPSRAAYEQAGFERWPVARYFRKL